MAKCMGMLRTTAGSHLVIRNPVPPPPPPAHPHVSTLNVPGL